METEEMREKLLKVCACLCGFNIRRKMKIDNLIGNVEELETAIEYVREIQNELFPKPVKPACKVFKFK